MNYTSLAPVPPPSLSPTPYLIYQKCWFWKLFKKLCWFLNSVLNYINNMELNLWNTKKLRPPPFVTCKRKDCPIKLTNVKKTLKRAITFYSQQKHLNVEAALLSRCIYRMRQKFRSSKDFKSLQKINKSVLSYHEMNITSALENLNNLFPSSPGVGYTYLPTRNVLHYVLVKLQGLSKLMCHLVDATASSMELFQSRIQIGHFWYIALLGSGIVSRIHVLAKRIIFYTCDLYQMLYSYCRKLRNPSVTNWLPDNYHLTHNLTEWLNEPWVTNRHCVESESDSNTTEVAHSSRTNTDNDRIQEGMEFSQIINLLDDNSDEEDT